MKWVAFRNTPYAPAASGDESVFFDCQYEILAARGVKAALAAENGTEKSLISAHGHDGAA
jgi:hypothetical protein